MAFDITEWSRIAEEDFKEMQFDSGMIIKNFDPTSITAPADEDILFTTSGNITASLVPNIVDLGEDVNNLHGQFAELQYISRYTATLGFTALNMSSAGVKLALGAATVGTGGKITANMKLELTDFTNLAWVGMRIGGGLVAVVLKSALSTGGFNLTTSKEGKGNLAVTMTGFMRMTAQDEPPMEFYIIAPTTTPSTTPPG